MNLLKVLFVVVILMAVCSIQAQDNSQNDTEFITFVKIEGKTCVSTNQAEFEQLQALSSLVDAMKEAKAHGTIDSTTYAEKTASYFKDARRSGIRIHNN